MSEGGIIAAVIAAIGGIIVDLTNRGKGKPPIPDPPDPSSPIGEIERVLRNDPYGDSWRVAVSFFADMRCSGRTLSRTLGVCKASLSELAGVSP